MYKQSSTKMATAINRQVTEETRMANKHKIDSGTWLGKLRTGRGGLFTGGIEFLFTAFGKIN